MPFLVLVELKSLSPPVLTGGPTAVEQGMSPGRAHSQAQGCLHLGARLETEDLEC